MNRARIVAVGCWLVGLASGSARADGADGTTVAAVSGAFQTKVPIGVSPYHGLEPKLALEYNSSPGRGGGLGVGWSVAGLSVIERSSPGKGAPRYDATDVFLLDGQKLVACAPGSSSPSCTSGGTHSTWIESYQKLSFDGTNWTVWRKDGVKQVYAPLLAGAQISESCTTSTPTLSGSADFTYIKSLQASGGTLTVTDTGDHVGHITLAGATWSGGFTATNNGYLTSLTSTPTSITVTDTHGASGTITVANAFLSGSLTRPIGLSGCGYGEQYSLQPYGICTANSGIAFSPLATCSDAGSSTSAGTFRWALASVTDTAGNNVQYHYWCDGSPAEDCYIDNVSYNGTVVRFNREPRPDPVVFATGVGFGSTNYRFTSVDVTVNGSRARAYAVSYGQTPGTGVSVLAQVQQYGRDATLDGSGHVTGGTALPPMRFSYNSDAQSWQERSHLNFPPSLANPGLVANTNAAADVNGDGLPDLITDDTTGGTRGWSVWLNTGSGFSYASHLNFPSGNCNPDLQVNSNGLYDFDGDGRTDLVVGVSTSGGYTFQVYRSNGSAFVYAATFGGVVSSCNLESQNQAVADVNGDGKADLVTQDKLVSGSTGWSVWLTRVDGTGAITFGRGGGVPDSHLDNPGGLNTADLHGASNSLRDFNGDGMVDLITNDTLTATGATGGSRGFSVWLSSGGGWTFASHLKYPANINQACLEGACSNAIADVNGDGAMDLITDDTLTSTGASGGARGWSVWLSDGYGNLVFASHRVFPYQVKSSDLHGSQNTLQDLNGDGKVDLVTEDQESGAEGWTVWLSDGAGFYYSDHTALPTGYYQTCLEGGCSNALADFNGDGQLDLLTHDTVTGSQGWSVWLRSDTGFVYFNHIAKPTNLNSWNLQGGGGNLLQDLNGDGQADLLTDDTVGGTRGWSSNLVSGHPSNLLASLTNGLGGTTTINYKQAPIFSTAQSSSSGVDTDSGSPVLYNTTFQPITANVVASVTMDDGRSGMNDGGAHVSSTLYSYDGGLYDVPSRTYYGFRHATTTLSATGAYSETYYWQRLASIAKPQAIYKRRADGSIISFEQLSFAENASPPYTSVTSAIWSYDCDGQGQFDSALPPNYVGGCKRVYTTYAWDAFGNITEEVQYGDYDVQGDERTYVRSFVPNQSTFVTNLPAYENLYRGLPNGDGSFPAGTLTTQLLYYYDHNSAYTNAPTLGALTQKSEWNDQTGGYVSTQFGYDEYGNEISITDPMGRTSTSTFDGAYHQYALAKIDSLGRATQVAYDYVLALPISRTDADGNLTTTSYDALGRQSQLTTPDGAIAATLYLNYGNPLTQATRSEAWDPTQNAWLYSDNYFDGLIRSYKTLTQAGVAVDTIYGSTGKVWKQSRPYGAGETPQYEVITYDEVGRPLAHTMPDGSQVSTSYSPGVTTSLDVLGHARTVRHDAWGRTLEIDETVGGQPKQTIFVYDVLGRRTQSTDELGNVTRASYDSLGRTLQKSDPDQGLWSYGYNIDSQLISETDALGHTTTLSVDAVGRVTKRLYPDGTSDQYVFDEAGHGSSTGRLTTALAHCAAGTDPTSCAPIVKTQLSYDTMGREVQYTETLNGNSYTIGHSYDQSGRLAAVIYPDGEIVTQSYGKSGTATGRLTGLSGNQAGTLLSDAGYTSSGQVARLVFGNGVTTSFQYDPTSGRATSMNIGALASFNYGYNAGGLITAVTGSENWSYQLDELGRLASANTPGYSQNYSYDAGGRVASSTALGNYGYSDPSHPHAVTAAGNNTYAYDANGNMISGAGRTLTYDYAHRPSAISSGGVLTTFVYNAMGARVQKISNTGTTTYIGTLYETNGGTVTKYYFAGGIRVAKRDVNGTAFLHTDHLGSLKLITDGGGNQVMTYEHTPYGTLLSAVGARPDPHRFTGHNTDDETGLIFFNARYYDPVLGRFISPDQFVAEKDNPQGLDLYAYANNSPINYVDPTGHAPLAILIVIAAAEAGAIGTTTAIVSIALITVGTALEMLTNNPILQTIGMVMAGIGGALGAGPLAGLNMAETCVVAATVALAESPISPLDPTVRTAIGWAYTAWGAFTNVEGQFESEGDGGCTPEGGGHSPMAWVNAIGRSALHDAETMVAAGAIGYLASLTKNKTVGEVMGLVGAYATAGGPIWPGSEPGYPGALAFVGSTYNFSYTLAYPGGRTYDLRPPGATSKDTFTFYYHMGYESPFSFGRQHIRVGTGNGFWELGSDGPNFFGPGLGWGGWITTQKITVIMDNTQASAFIQALTSEAKHIGGYIIFVADSYAYISNALKAATGVSAADLHINPGLFAAF